MITAIATTANKDRFRRAAKGGEVSMVNLKFYKGGQFMPLAREEVQLLTNPARLEGSSRQIAWATRIRSEMLAVAETRLAELLTGMDQVKPGFRPFFQAEVQKLTVTRHRILTQTDASAFIDVVRA